MNQTKTQPITAELHPNFALACLQLLYWVFFCPLTLRDYTGTLVPGLEADFPLWRARNQLKSNSRLRRLLQLQYVTTLLFPWLISLPILIGLNLFGVDVDWGGVAFGVVIGVGVGLTGGMVLGVAYGVAFGVAVGVAYGVAFGVAVGVAGGVTVGVITGGGVAGGVALGVANGVASGVAFGVLFSRAVGVAVGMAVGVAVGVANGVAGDVGFSVTGGVVSGMAVGVASGVAVGVLFSRAAGVAVGVAFGVAGGVAVGVAFGVTFGVAGGVAVGVAVGVSFVLAYFRLIYYWFELPVQLLLSYLARLRPDKAAIYSRYAPVFWDEWIWLPLPFLDGLLRRSFAHNQEEGLAHIERVAQSFRQGWAAKRALAWITADTLRTATTPTTIVTSVAQTTWLPEDLTPLGRDVAEIFPGLQAVSQNIERAIAADNIYSQRLTWREALDQLNTLDNRIKALGRLAVQRWAPVIDQWHKVISAALLGLTAEKVDGTTENPYQPGNPLQLNRKALFKGRQSLRDSVVNALLERNRPTLVLQGPRRMGKTSFLLQLPALLPGRTVPVFLDLQRPAVTQDTAAFLFSIARAISRDTKPYRLIVAPPRRADFEAVPFEAFDSWLEEVVWPKLQDFNLLLTFDEFEKLGEAVGQERLDHQIFDQLRYLIQHQTRLALLFAGVQSLDELGQGWSSYFINIKPLTIDYLNPTEAEALIRQPDSEADFRLTYTDEVVADIMTVTHCQPYLLQLVCSAIVEECNARHMLHAKSGVLDAALVRALDNGEPYFRNVWDEMAGADGQALLRQVATSATPVALPDSLAVTRLLRRRVISRVGNGYHVEIPLVRRWVVERAG